MLALIVIAIISVWTFLALRSLQELGREDAIPEFADNSSPMWTRLLSVVYWFGNLPALLFIVFYISIILGFSFIYTSLPSRHFFHSMSRYEFEPMTAEAREIIQQVEQSIRDGFISYYGNTYTAIDDWLLDVTEFNVNRIDVSEYPDTGKMRFHIYSSSYLMKNGEIQASTHGPATFDVSLQSRLIGNGTIFLYPEFEENYVMTVEGQPSVPADSLFLRSGMSAISVDAPVLALSPALYNRIVDFGEGYRGFPSAIRGHWARMLYFSAGIATSSAFGDIVPLTPLARSLVTAESITALVIVGLFLNSLGMLIAKRDTGKRTDDKF